MYRAFNNKDGASPSGGSGRRGAGSNKSNNGNHSGMVMPTAGSISESEVHHHHYAAGHNSSTKEESATTISLESALPSNAAIPTANNKNKPNSTGSAGGGVAGFEQLMQQHQAHQQHQAAMLHAQRQQQAAAAMMMHQAQRIAQDMFQQQMMQAAGFGRFPGAAAHPMMGGYPAPHANMALQQEYMAAMAAQQQAADQWQHYLATLHEKDQIEKAQQAFAARDQLQRGRSDHSGGSSGSSPVVNLHHHHVHASGLGSKKRAAAAAAAAAAAQGGNNKKKEQVVKVPKKTQLNIVVEEGECSSDDFLSTAASSPYAGNTATESMQEARSAQLETLKSMLRDGIKLPIVEEPEENEDELKRAKSVDASPENKEAISADPEANLRFLRRPLAQQNNSHHMETFSNSLDHSDSKKGKQTPRSDSTTTKLRLPPGLANNNQISRNRRERHNMFASQDARKVNLSLDTLIPHDRNSPIAAYNYLQALSPCHSGEPNEAFSFYYQQHRFKNFVESAKAMWDKYLAAARSRSRLARATPTFSSATGFDEDDGVEIGPDTTVEEVFRCEENNENYVEHYESDGSSILTSANSNFEVSSAESTPASTLNKKGGGKKENFYQ